MRLTLPQYDPSARYLAARPLTVNGVALQAGDPMPETLSPHKKRALYFNRFLLPAPTIAPAKPGKKKG